MIDPNIVNRKPEIPVPSWARAFFRDLCEEYQMRIPLVHWIECEDETGGWYVHGRREIYIIACGNITVDAHSIAHEFAHYITEEGHGPAMYATLLDITERFSMDYEYMESTELDYQPVQYLLGLCKRI